jgi:hypothetical protein
MPDDIPQAAIKRAVELWDAELAHTHDIRKVRSGQMDGTDHVNIAHAALRRGIELGQSK